MSKVMEDKLNRMLEVSMELIGLCLNPALGGVPEGELYAQFTSAGFSLETFQGLMATLERRKLITRSNHLVKPIQRATGGAVADVDVWRG